ncbi:MAG TPA: ornithine decarboxylase [Candidatus Limnocylindria bacterium]|nr:ornithine decarboxylase [Candidatus Limnocylindria bacterium]
MIRTTGNGRSGGTAEVALYNFPRFRTDQWNHLRDAARRLARGARDAEEQRVLLDACAGSFDGLAPIESCFAFPGRRAFHELRRMFEQRQFARLGAQTVRLVRLLTSGACRRLDLLDLRIHDYADLLNIADFSAELQRRILQEQRPYFEVLVVDDITPAQELELQMRLRTMRRPDDAFIYEVVVARTFERALMAALVNPDIQAAVARYSFPFRAEEDLQELEPLYPILDLDRSVVEAMMPGERTRALGRALAALRPELDLFLVTDAPVEQVVGESSRAFRRVFYHEEDYQELHFTLLKGVHNRYETPFFDALRRYSRKPTGVFHALPISRGSSVTKSHWIQDMGRFYGDRVFQAETSATTAGLDSLSQPVGTLKRAQELASRAFGSRETFFVTNGTSTANKIVMQALMRPDDIILLSHDCHKSHPYAVILAGARPVYLDAYPLSKYAMYGGVTLREIKRRLLDLRRAGKLDRVKLLLLTSITFDGITYDPVRVMEEVLAIKPDMVFLWDEAWFAYGRFWPTLRVRTAMHAANRLRARQRSEAWRQRYEAWKEQFDALDPDDDATWLDHRLMPDPGKARIRVYATHSTHKTLTALRQGSMIHVNDDDFEHGVQSAFHEAYMTHTSTSPNYQILASLDVGRRQVELEGYDLVQRSIQNAVTLRERIRSDSLLQKYFRVLGPGDMIPAELRASGIRQFWDAASGWANLEEPWRTDEFVLDPTRVTVDVGRTGMAGDTFKKLLIERFDIQINKTSRNTVLFMVHIGTTRGGVAHLVKVLTTIAEELEDRRRYDSPIEARLHAERVASLVERYPPLPNFSRFHGAFLEEPGQSTREGDMRTAFFLAYDDAACDFVPLDAKLTREVEAGREVVSAAFVTPYPPGFPILVPGQVITAEILSYLEALDVKEIHGYEPEYGLRVFRDDVLARRSAGAAERELTTVGGDS